MLKSRPSESSVIDLADDIGMIPGEPHGPTDAN
jgi:hypothetical protein